MGTEIYGLKPEKSEGKYFRQSTGTWPPLWEYVCRVSPDLLSKRDVESGEGGEGHKIGRAKAEAIGRRLHALLDTGETQVYSLGLGVLRATRSGARSLAAAKKVAKPSGGTVTVPFTVESVKEFADFCLACGGFEIG